VALNGSILRRTRLGTVLAALVLALPLGALVSWPFAAGTVATALWAVVSFWVLERLLRASVLPPGTPRNVFAIVLWGGAKLAVYAVAIWVLVIRPFPALSHIVGLTLLLVMLVVQGALQFPRHATDRQPVRRGEDG
jgi:hypothetical protein